MKTRLALEAVLLLHSSGSWNDAKATRWQEICLEMLGPRSQNPRLKNLVWPPTPKILCDLVRKAMEGSQTIR